MDEQKTFELEVVSVRLVKDNPIYSEKKITCAKDAIAILGDLLSEMDREVVCIINLKMDGTPINCSFASIGAVEHAVAHPRDLLKCAILSNAVGMIMVHNHPSGSLQPSKDDCRITDNMLQLSRLLNINFLDHIIVGGDNREYFSFSEKGRLETPCMTFKEDYKELDFSSKGNKSRGR